MTDQQNNRATPWTPGLQQKAERISIATYLAARQSLLAKARSYRQWCKSDPSNAAKWGAYLLQTQRQLAAVRFAERIPLLSQGGSAGL